MPGGSNGMALALPWTESGQSNQGVQIFLLTFPSRTSFSRKPHWVQLQGTWTSGARTGLRISSPDIAVLHVLKPYQLQGKELNGITVAHTHPAIQKPFLNRLWKAFCNKEHLSNCPSVLTQRNVIEIKKHNSNHKGEQIPERTHASWASSPAVCQGNNHGRLWIQVPTYGLRYG